MGRKENKGAANQCLKQAFSHTLNLLENWLVCPAFYCSFNYATQILKYAKSLLMMSLFFTKRQII
jgi:formate/nitrite transporter FocA (FNT family)